MSSIPWPSPNVRDSARYGVALRQRVQRWARKRQGIDRRQPARPGRVYILPTGVGLIFGLMAFAMLLGSMNYNNNLSFVLTFLLTGIGFVAMHQCQRNLVGLELSFRRSDPVFAGQSHQFRIAVTNHIEERPLRHSLYAPTRQVTLTTCSRAKARYLYCRRDREARLDRAGTIWRTHLVSV